MIGHRWKALLGLALLAASPWQAGQPHWYQEIAPFRVIGGVYYVGSEGLAAWLIPTSKGHILLDSGTPENATLVERNIATLGYKLSDVKILLNSHAHFDHAGGHAALKVRSGALVYASLGDKEALERGVYIGSEDDASLAMPPVTVDRIVRDGQAVTLGGVTLRAVLTPGHSPGCTSWLMRVQEARRMHTAFFFCSATVAANRLAPRPQYPGIIEDYRKTFKRLRTIKADVFLGAHGEFFDLDRKRAAIGKGGPNPFIVPGEMRSVTSEMEEAFERTLARQQAQVSAK